MPTGRRKIPGAKGLYSWLSDNRGKQPPPPRKIPMSEIVEHNTTEDFWIVINGAVYDITQFQHYHPGGVEIMLPAAGANGTALFNQYHKWVNAESMLASVLLGYAVGDAPARPTETAPSLAAPPSTTEAAETAMGRLTLSGSPPPPPYPGPPTAVSPSDAPRAPPFSPVTFTDFRVTKRTGHTHNTILLRLQSLSPALSIPLCGHIHIAAPDQDGAQIFRSYTPVATGAGWLDVLVKRYPEGAVSLFLHSLEVGAVVRCRGPFQSDFRFDREEHRHLVLLAGGTGVAPFVRLLNHVVGNAPDCKVTLVCSNRSERDILFAQWLAECMANHPGQVTVRHVLTEPPAEGGRAELVMRGHLTARYLSAYCPPPGAGTHVLVCGPQGFNLHCAALLGELDFPSEAVTLLGA